MSVAKICVDDPVSTRSTLMENYTRHTDSREGCHDCRYQIRYLPLGRNAANIGEQKVAIPLPATFVGGRDEITVGGR